MSYEDLKKRVALLKDVERQEQRSRKEAAAKEAAEVARAKDELALREKENDSRVANARKALDHASERSQKMRAHYEEQLRKMQSKLDQTQGRLEAVKEKAAADAAAAPK
mmetsp:Transcript_2469/g.5538  ORF Transcript_2469/g.5538 Transcript_2469/m.5538 type:complete len:109 (-) Transcript_2469:73-399(-)